MFTALPIFVSIQFCSSLRFINTLRKHIATCIFRAKQETNESNDGDEEVKLGTTRKWTSKTSHIRATYMETLFGWNSVLILSHTCANFLIHTFFSGCFLLALVKPQQSSHRQNFFENAWRYFIQSNRNISGILFLLSCETENEREIDR